MVDETWMQSFDSQLKQQNAEWCAQMSMRKKIAWRSQGCGIHACHVLQQNGLVLDHPIPIGMMVNGQYYCTTLQDALRPALHHKQPELPEHSFIFSRAMQYLIANVTCYSWCHTSLGHIGTSSVLSRSCPMWLLVVCMCGRTSLGSMIWLSEQGRIQSCNWSFTT